MSQSRTLEPAEQSTILLSIAMHSLWLGKFSVESFLNLFVHQNCCSFIFLDFGFTSVARGTIAVALVVMVT